MSCDSGTTARHEEQMKTMRRAQALQKRLDGVFLSEFTAGEFPMLFRAMGLQVNPVSLETTWPSEEEFALLEERLKRRGK